PRRAGRPRDRDAQRGHRGRRPEPGNPDRPRAGAHLRCPVRNRHDPRRPPASAAKMDVIDWVASALRGRRLILSTGIVRESDDDNPNPPRNAVGLFMGGPPRAWWV